MMLPYLSNSPTRMDKLRLLPAYLRIALRNNILLSTYPGDRRRDEPSHTLQTLATTHTMTVAGDMMVVYTACLGHWHTEIPIYRHSGLYQDISIATHGAVRQTMGDVS